MNEDHVAEQLAEAMETQGIAKLEMAARMKTSRRQLDRLFDPSIPSVMPDTFRPAANAVGRSLRIESVSRLGEAASIADLRQMRGTVRSRRRRGRRLSEAKAAPPVRLFVRGLLLIVGLT
jgi:hypothetical protein